MIKTFKKQCGRGSADFPFELLSIWFQKPYHISSIYRLKLIEISVYPSDKMSADQFKGKQINYYKKNSKKNPPLTNIKSSSGFFIAKNLNHS